MQSIRSVGPEVKGDGGYIKFGLLETKNASDGHVFALKEQNEFFTLPEHLSSPPVFSGVRVTHS